MSRFLRSTALGPIRGAAKYCIALVESPKQIFRLSCPNRNLQQSLRGCESQSDISDHLGDIFFRALDAPDSLIVELGTRGGESTRALLAAAAEKNQQVLSIDIDPCEPDALPHSERWTFVQADDIEFGQTEFPRWCEDAGTQPMIGTLFIDTSHEYEHTVREIEVWFPYLAPQAMVIFHDTNMGDGLYTRLDRSTGYGWGNDRGVIRAIEEFLDRKYDETTQFSDCTPEFLVRHVPYCSGLTVLRKRGRA